ncbi:sugar transferase [Mycobacterium sp. PSTR-4-N]|uniref:sugar transferase n=1 Tax=Mycobacterium sp. PSTR-4-N TaxID=2917745 RepID=UPI001F149E7A|nr:sugar transferase [Mycobacterium sp. PSTR-4-N]MCG7593980.1 sugar transferase [Mycobacterium sp. PSTR-4-N]
MTGVIDAPQTAKTDAVDRQFELRMLSGVSPARRRKAWSPVVAMAVDLTTASAAVAIGMTVANYRHQQLPPWQMMCFFAPTVVGLFAIRGLYKRSLNRSFLDELPKIEALTAVAAMLLMTGLVLNPDIEGSRSTAVAQVWVCAAVLIPLGRLLWFAARTRLIRRDKMISPTLIVGNGRIAAKVVERLEVTPGYGLRPIGLIDDDLPSMGVDRDKPASIPYLGKLDTLEDAIDRTNARCLIVAFSRTRDEAITAAVKVAHRRGLAVWIVPRVFDTIGVHASIDHIGGLPLISVPSTDPRGWQFAVKHFSDRLVATIGLVLISPLFLSLMLAVRLSSPGPIFFGQARVGRDGRVFDCLKFRSMRPPSEADASFERRADSAPGGVEGEDRRTRIGKIMRATSLDELPQLINVIRGEMSLVGPRPERPEYVDLFNAQIARYGDRHRVKAGMTGWAQVHGLRGQTSIADRAEWDNFYIENWSLWLDWKILAMTVGAVLQRAE